MKTLMFHYVRPKNNEEFPYLKAFDSDLFERFVKLNQKSILNRSEIQNLGKNKVQPSAKILLTFDDGLSDHHKYVYKTLKKYDVSGLFFINTKSIVDGIMDSVHKIHFMYGKYGWRFLVQEIQKAAKLQNVCLDIAGVHHQALNAYPLDDIEIANLKFVLNHKLDLVVKENLINFVFENNRCDQAGYYLSRENIIEMSDDGMCFGYHGHEHLPFSSLSSKQICRSLNQQNIFFDAIGAKRPKFLSFPFGDAKSYNKDNLKVLEQFCISIAFSADSDICSEGVVTMLPRYDCASLLNE